MHPQSIPWNAPQAANPFIPGYGADPSLVEAAGKIYLYATRDGGDPNAGLAVWESSDFKNWTTRELNWPTKKLCQTAEATDFGVWAPSVVRGQDGKFYMYVSVGSEVWAGRADHPLGPWTNLLGDKPLISRDWDRRYHMIDAEAFLDDDGVAYLYWGSGWDFKDGHCFVVKLNPDMHTFEGEPIDITPTNYFEGPFVIKRQGRYYLMYSNGIFMDDTYRVHYAIGDSPLGPFTEGKNSPVLQSDHRQNILGPGHHAVFHHEGSDYIVYHRHGLPFGQGGRQICLDELRFAKDGSIEKVLPTHEGPAFVQRHKASLAAIATASTSFSPDTPPSAILDANYATHWSPAPDDRAAWIQLDLESERTIPRQEILISGARTPIPFDLQVSTNGKTWTDLHHSRVTGSTVEIDTPTVTRHLRLVFSEGTDTSSLRILGWNLT